MKRAFPATGEAGTIDAPLEKKIKLEPVYESSDDAKPSQFVAKAESKDALQQLIRRLNSPDRLERMKAVASLETAPSVPKETQIATLVAFLKVRVDSNPRRIA